jgi:hypothetical protein
MGRETLRDEPGRAVVAQVGDRGGQGMEGTPR